MAKTFKTAAEAAAFLADDPGVREQVEQATRNCALLSALVGMRVTKGITQREVAERMGCNSSKISKMESGDDLMLKWGDVVAYLSALGVGMNMVFEDDSLPASERIKMHVFAIHRQLEKLADLAESVDGDSQITDKINQFYGEVLFNFLSRFEDNYQKLQSVITVSSPSEASGLAEQKASASLRAGERAVC